MHRTALTTTSINYSHTLKLSFHSVCRQNCLLIFHLKNWVLHMAGRTLGH